MLFVTVKGKPVHLPDILVRETGTAAPAATPPSPPSIE
jgi:hypothetical protein